MDGSDLRCRNVNCIAVEDKTDLPDPAKPFSHKKGFFSVSQAWKVELCTNHAPVPKCYLAYAAWWLTVASGAWSHWRIFSDIWLFLTKSNKSSILAMVSWIFFLSLSCSTSTARERLLHISPISLSSFCKMLCRKRYTARCPATLMTVLIPLEVDLLNFWQSAWARGWVRRNFR